MSATRFLHVLLLACLAVAWVELDPSLIPPIPDSLPVYSLDSPSFLSNDWLEEIIGNVAAGTKFVEDENDECKLYAYDGDDLVAFIDKRTGETRVYPDFAKIEAAINPIDIHAVKAFSNASLVFPSDDTHFDLVKGSSLVGSVILGSPDAVDHTKRWNDEAESTYLTHGIVQRWVESGGTRYPVCGPGSQASFGVGPDNKILSLFYSWRAAKKSEQDIKAKPAHKVISSIKEALESKARESDGVKVYHVDACFYDSGVRFMQPVYRVYGETYANAENKTVDSARILRYFPIGDDSPEAILPQGTFEGEQPPVEPQTMTHSSRSFLNYFDARAAFRRVIKPTITVGRYVTRNDTYQAEWLVDANAFWANLQTSTIINFVNSQYYWAYQRLYGTEASSYANSVNVLLTESHGSNHLISTLANRGDVDAVNIPSTLPTGGYGPNNNGHLAYWLIDSCEVIPARIDFASDPAPLSSAFDAWWPVFNGGLHAIVGWRTSAFFSDNVASNTATAMARGRPVASAWLDAAHSDPAYNGRPTYVAPATGVNQPLGRAAVLYPCGHGSDKVWQIENLGKATCLEMRYYNND